MSEQQPNFQLTLQREQITSSNLPLELAVVTLGLTNNAEREQENKYRLEVNGVTQNVVIFSYPDGRIGVFSPDGALQMVLNDLSTEEKAAIQAL